MEGRANAKVVWSEGRANRDQAGQPVLLLFNLGFCSEWAAEHLAASLRFTPRRMDEQVDGHDSVHPLSKPLLRAFCVLVAGLGKWIQ